MNVYWPKDFLAAPQSVGVLYSLAHSAVEYERDGRTDGANKALEMLWQSLTAAPAPALVVEAPVDAPRDEKGKAP